MLQADNHQQVSDPGIRFIISSRIWATASGVYAPCKMADNPCLSLGNKSREQAIPASNPGALVSDGLGTRSIRESSLTHVGQLPRSFILGDSALIFFNIKSICSRIRSC